MISVSEARTKAAKYFDRHYQAWAVNVFAQALCVNGEVSFSELSSEFSTEILTCPSILWALPLHPPTEQQVLDDVSGAQRWVRSWRNDSYEKVLQWTSKSWKSVGPQEVPLRLTFDTPEALAAFVGKAELWRTVSQRSAQLAEKWLMQWQPHCPCPDEQELILAVKRTVKRYSELSEVDWRTLLLMLDWLVNNQELRLYARQLPIRGVDGKWFEKHKTLVEPLYSAMTGAGEGLEFVKVPSHIRVRFLDKDLAPGGLDDIAVSPADLNRLELKPQRVIVCENLVSVMTLPALAGTIALHGGGYSVAVLSQIAWLSEVPLWYWGDLDSNGFAILNRLRHHFPHAESILMDSATLAQHLDLCVVEEAPNRGTFDRLTLPEQQVLDTLLAGQHALRLEQERIEWNYVLNTIMQL